jgi:hypothetical protein
VWRGEEIARERQQASPEVLRWLDPGQRAQAEELVRSGEAMRLYRGVAGD